MEKTIVIGGGPSGMMAAISASEKTQVTLIEKNEKLGKKLYITGKGRCNITNSKDISEFFDYIPTNSSFLYSALYSFTNRDTMNFFENEGVHLKIERGDRVFPNSDKSSDIISALQKRLYKNNVNVLLNTEFKDFIIRENKIESVVLSNGESIKGDYFIISTGGLSYPQTGSTGESFPILKKLGHSITELRPSLVPIEVKESWIKDLQGLSLKNVELKVLNSKNKEVYKDFGEMLFTHFGISGPIALSSSSFIKDYKDYKVVINLKPALSNDELDKRIQKDFQKNINKDFKNALDELLPKKIIETIIRLSEIDENKKVNLITKEERRNLCNLIQNFTLNVKGLRPIAEAIITSGGVNVKQIDPSTMKSKIITNLYFSGEIIDVDAFTGGFNLQIALSTGYLSGKMIGDD
ncbi:MAG: aminoacetone oxidase family FAD-binding enzyme [Clostridiaceae bacterium]|jgi:predicted Rossmann fold flavoprotein|nr:aminoacetone oxidase family FAD-binding enzyme [Clostridiaceae bacterium]